MSHFKEAFSRTLEHEGEYSFCKQDPGQETYMGISRVYWPGWPGWHLIDRYKKEAVPLDVNRVGLMDLVESFYQINFWIRMQGDKVAAVSLEVACELFDTAVNLDAPDAVRFLQIALDMQRLYTRSYQELMVDGLLGHKTLSALDRYLDIQPGDRESNEKILLNCMYGEQYVHYKENPQHPYFRGWFLRV